MWVVRPAYKFDAQCIIVCFSISEGSSEVGGCSRNMQVRKPMSGCELQLTDGGMPDMFHIREVELSGCLIGLWRGVY